MKHVAQNATKAELIDFILENSLWPFSDQQGSSGRREHMVDRDIDFLRVIVKQIKREAGGYIETAERILDSCNLLNYGIKTDDSQAERIVRYAEAMAAMEQYARQMAVAYAD